MTSQSADESSVSTNISDTSSTRSSRELKTSQKHEKNKAKGKSRQNDAALTPAEQELYATHAHEIRRNAKQILNTNISPSTNRYRSYHDSPATFVSSDSSVRHPSTTDTYSQQSYGVGDALSVSQVASMAFNCISHCLTEGYRAASNYYSTYEQEGKFNHNYQQVGRREDEDSNSTNFGGDRGHDSLSGYQNQHMDRDLPPLSAGKASEKDIGQCDAPQSDIPLKGEYATVPLPSTYQGGNNVYVLK
ncbi:hypothetical protein HJC23_003087 [Cyclotella cryptica]|uniref:Uncharacterized protein n=1 Tax=Cyclotella cryptica TaxID=29204 RepID=A0ABD3P5T5_9STRA|eukprot:CCRYP_017675-RA/>CCRYP_017675-RA protein AED:0.16 eAED:0.16 QI:0/-1/0/1/-1/1/1/0/246